MLNLSEKPLLAADGASFGASCQAAVVPTKEMIEEVRKGKVDSWDYSIEVHLTNGDAFVCHYDWDADGRNYHRIEEFSPDKAFSKVVNFESLAECMKGYIFDAMASRLCKGADSSAIENARNIFVLGEEKGSEVNKRNEWADQFCGRLCREIAFQAQKFLPEGVEVTGIKFENSYARMPGTGYRNNVYKVSTSNGRNLQITERTNCGGAQSDFYSSYDIQWSDVIENSQKEFGRRAANLAKKAGVPWNVAVFAGHIKDDGEAISVLQTMKENVVNFSHCNDTPVIDGILYELGCGINRRTSAIKDVISEKLFRELHCSSQNQTSKLAHYVASTIREEHPYYKAMDELEKTGHCDLPSGAPRSDWIPRDILK